MMRALFLTSQSLITRNWPVMESLLTPVLSAANGEFEIGDLEELCRDGRALSVLVLEDDRPLLAAVLEWRFFPRTTTLIVIALGGSGMRGAARTFWQQLRSWALESGASHIEACTNDAMARMLKPLGFVRTYNVMRAPC